MTITISNITVRDSCFPKYPTLDGCAGLEPHSDCLPPGFPLTVKREPRDCFAFRGTA